MHQLKFNFNIDYRNMSQETKDTDVSPLDVVYVCDRKLFIECDKIPNIRGRVFRTSF
jgi:hypothetical protein